MRADNSQLVLVIDSQRNDHVSLEEHLGLVGHSNCQRGVSRAVLEEQYVSHRFKDDFLLMWQGNFQGRGKTRKG